MDKKKLLSIPILATVAVLGLAGILNSRASTDGDFNVTEGVLHSYNGTAFSVVVPPSVKTVGREAFSGNTFIQEVSFSDSVTKIDESAFKDCSALKKVTIPDSVASLGDSAFWGCSELSSVYIGAGLKSLGSGAFSDCDSLSAVSISDGNPYLLSEGSAIFDASRTKMYQYLAGSAAGAYGIPENVEDISRYAFWGCDNLLVLTVNGMKYIPDHAFSNCTSLRSVSMQVPSYEIGIKAFSGCPNLSQVIIPQSVGKIHETAFDGCPENMYIICDTYSYAQRFADEHFYPVSPKEVISVEVVNGYVSVPDGDTDDAQGDYIAAGDETMPQKGEAIADSDTAQEHNGLRVTVDGVVLGNSTIVSDRAYVQLPSGSIKVIDGSTVPEPAIRLIEDHAHYLDQTLTEFDFEPGLTGIGDFAFARTNIGSVRLPEGMTTVGEGAFYHCDRLFEVQIPGSVEYVGKNAFNYTPWYNNWMSQASEGDLLIVGDGVLIGIKGEKTGPLPANVKHVAEGVLE